MRCLIVTSHPLEISLCQTLADMVVRFLIGAWHECRLVDLYKAGFSPALSTLERASYYSSFNSDSVTREIDDLLWAEAIILIFPTWWFSVRISGHS
ncbi:NAD(P)H-dependent oxidoreductase [Mesorhizobium sp. VK24D]|uniref:NAD(P)H-dependent oxidoreductase n=1 Tax=Mesorhizobium album TaxID=3072314 RepID=A0ABU4Y8Z6_9HYPH|nr:NAD(P)H-dependent oxidoreductase [Mesorhizobium sp. VK24D]MDX8482570.1 NAD(P)H-dependent oxidoreductase [Mesorhizobium sp. VK24D]